VLLSCPDDQALDGQLKAIQQFLEAHVGLRFLEPVLVRRLKPEAFRSEQLAKFTQPQARARRRAEWRLWQALGLINDVDSADQEFCDLYLRSLRGFYDFDTREIVMPEGELEQAKSLAHELHHALLDQHYKIGKLLRESEKRGGDALTATQAMVEGLATLDEEVFEVCWQNARDERAGWPTSAELDALREKFRRTVNSGQAQPPGGWTDQQRMVIDSMFPYRWGAWHMANRARGGDKWQSAYARLLVTSTWPRSTREVLHPGEAATETGGLARYLRAWADRRGVHQVKVEPFGEFGVRLWTGLPLVSAVADEKEPLGLADDVVALFEDADGVEFGVVVLVFESEAQAILFVTQLPQLDGRFLQQFQPRRAGSRSVLIPLGGTAGPDAAREVVEVAERWATDLPAGAPVDGSLLARLRIFVDHPAPTVWEQLLRELAASRSQLRFGQRLAQVLFQIEDDNEPGAAAANDDRDCRAIQFGIQALELRQQLAEDVRTSLIQAALAALSDSETLPVGRVNALRWLAAERDRLTREQCTEALRAAGTAFHGRPAFASLIQNAFSREEPR
jgi:hypothetical protein